jgi:hypothetical protein
LDVGLEPVPRDRMSGLVKTIIVVESICLAMLAFWLDREYQNNIYLQQYVHNTAWTYLPVLAFIATFSVAVGASEAYSRVGGRNLGSPSIEPSVAHGMLLTGGFQAAQSTSSQDSGTLAQGRQGESGGLTPPGVSFAQVFEDSRPVTVLKHIEPDETLGNYAPPAYPVIKRLKPARDPVVREISKPAPRPLNRVGLAPGFALPPPPPVIRQINRPGSGTKRDDTLPNRPGARNEETEQESERSVMPRPPKRKQVVDDNLGNDFVGE